MSKIDGVHYPLGCTTPNCPRRHVPLPALGQFAAVDKAELLYASGTHDRADSRSQLVRLVASSRCLMRYFGSFSLFFFQLAVNELDWMSSEANVLRLCAALDKLRLGSLRGPPSRRSSYWLGGEINPFNSFIHCLKHSLVF